MAGMNVPASSNEKRSRVIIKAFFDRGRRVIGAISLGKKPGAVVKVSTTFCAPSVLRGGNGVRFSAGISSKASATFSALLLLSVLDVMLSWGGIVSTVDIALLVMLSVGVPSSRHSSTDAGSTCKGPPSANMSDMVYLPEACDTAKNKMRISHPYFGFGCHLRRKLYYFYYVLTISLVTRNLSFCLL